MIAVNFDVNESLEQISHDISNSLKQYEDDLLKQISDSEKEKEAYAEDYRKASAQGDRSENAELTVAIEGLSKVNRKIKNARVQLRNIKTKVKDHSNYKPVGKVVVYSTVKLARLGPTGETYVFKVFPPGISDLERRILDVESRIGRAILLRQKGDIVHVEHELYGTPVKWVIEDIY